MPFTPTHVAAILPVWRLAPRHLPLSALAIGSMIPDFLMFVPGLHEYYWLTHSRRGIITACLPLGIGFFLLFQLIAKRPLLDLAPEAIRRRLPGHFEPTIRPSLSFFFAVAIATLIGSLSHVTWDAFTHEGRLGVRLVPALNDEWFTLLGFRFTGFVTLQHFSSVVLLPAMFVGGIRWLRRQDECDTPVNPLSIGHRSFFLALLLLVPPVFALVHIYLRMGWPTSQSSFNQFAGWSVKTAMGIMLVFFGAYCAAYYQINDKPHPPV